MKSQPSGEIFPVKKTARRQINPSQPSDGSSSEIGGLVGGMNSTRSPLNEASPTQNLSIESPIQVPVSFSSIKLLFSAQFTPPSFISFPA